MKGLLGRSIILPWYVWVTALGTIVLNAIDALLTLCSLTNPNVNELNPVMGCLIARGPLTFVFGKMIIISMAIFLLMVTHVKNPRVVAGTLFAAYSAYLIVCAGNATLFLMVVMS